jgi:hypothetical protein
MPWFQSYEEQERERRRKLLIAGLVRNLVYRAKEDELLLDDDYRKRYAAAHYKEILTEKTTWLSEQFDICAHEDLLEALKPYPAVVAWMAAREAMIRTAELIALDAKLAPDATNAQGGCS